MSIEFRGQIYSGKCITTNRWGDPVLHIVHPWERRFIFRSKRTVGGKIVKGFRFINRRHMIIAEGADGYDMYKYATDRELFKLKLKGDEWDKYV